MSLTELNTQIESIREQASRYLTHNQEQRRFVNNSPNLTPAGKQAEIDELKAEANTAIGALRAQEDELVNTTIRDLQRKIRGTVGQSPDAIILFRDAQERADRLATPDDAMTAMRSALLSEDKGLAQAILNRALELGWRAVTETYADHNPELAEAVTDLAALTHRQNDVSQIIMRSMQYGI